MSDLGDSSTPKIEQFRAGSYKTCNLIPCTDTRRYSIDLLNPVGPFYYDDA